MRRTLLAACVVFISIALIGCGGGGGGGSAPPSTTTTQILSDPSIDGDIPAPSGTITEGMSFPTVQSVFAGIDPSSGNEDRAFLDFPLSGPGGVPGDAVIVSATLDIVIDNVVLQSPGDTIPIRVDLVSFTPPLAAGDFDRTILTPIASVTATAPISSADIGSDVLIDVTSLMVQAQALGLSDFQVRILEDLVAAPPGLIEIDDSTGANRGSVAPLIQVSYF